MAFAVIAAGAQHSRRSSAIVAFGQAVQVGNDLFQEFLAENPSQIVLVYLEKGMLKKPTTWYQISHKGFLFYTGIQGELTLPPEADILPVQEIKLPHQLSL